MRFLVDAQLPRRLAHCLRQEGLEVKLLLVSTGNIKNAELEVLFLASLAEIVAGFQHFDFLEITRKAVISHA
jgi:predicted nuclease of predicted toxin-antitoxin system